jgi:MtrB/PioB family decaheme-associated outer membrane protein
MLKRTLRSRRILVAPLILLAPTLGFAQVDTSDWACESCPFDQEYRAEIEGGATYVSDDAVRFGNFTGYDEKGTYPLINGQGRYSGDKYLIDYTLEDIGLDSQAFGLSVGAPGKFELNLGYRELPFRRFGTASTIFDRPASDSLALPSGWVPVATTAEMAPQLPSSLRPQKIGTDRQVIDLGANWNASDKYLLFADFRRQTKDGIDISSAGSYTQASFLPRVIDYETDQVDAGVHYNTANASFTVAYYGSFFTNNNASLTWETPFLAEPGATSLRMAAEPDNEYSQVSLSGQYRIKTWDTVFAFLVASGRGKQNQALLPYTINPDIDAGALPRDNLDGEVDTSNYSFTIASRPSTKTRLQFFYRYDERDNGTPIDQWSRVVVDSFPSGDPEPNLAYSFEREDVGLSGEYAFSRKLKVSAGYDRKRLDRNYQEVVEQLTDRGWGQVRWRPAQWLDIRAKGGAEQRGHDGYDETLGSVLGQNPLMRKYNLAYRYREFGELTASIMPLESPVSLSATVLFADDEYKESLIGLNGSEEMRGTVDLSWAISDGASLYVLYGHDRIDAHQTGSQQFDWWDWSAFHEDRFDHFGFGMTWRPADGRFNLGFSLDRAEGSTGISLDSLSGGPSTLPDLESTLDTARIEASYDFTDRWSGTFDLRYERFEMTDWALVSQTTLPLILTSGAQPYDYDVYAVGIGIRYRFGDDEISLAD